MAQITARSLLRYPLLMTIVWSADTSRHCYSPEFFPVHS